MRVKLTQEGKTRIRVKLSLITLIVVDIIPILIIPFDLESLKKVKV